MAKQIQEEPKTPRFDIRCFKCVPTTRWESEEITPCPRCGNTHLFADDRKHLTSRDYEDGKMVMKEAV